jgi:hypothetical protein
MSAIKKPDMLTYRLQLPLFATASYIIARRRWEYGANIKMFRRFYDVVTLIDTDVCRKRHPPIVPR